MKGSKQAQKPPNFDVPQTLCLCYFATLECMGGLGTNPDKNFKLCIKAQRFRIIDKCHINQIYYSRSGNEGSSWPSFTPPLILMSRLLKIMKIQLRKITMQGVQAEHRVIIIPLLLFAKNQDQSLCKACYKVLRNLAVKHQTKGRNWLLSCFRQEADGVEEPDDCWAISKEAYRC